MEFVSLVGTQAFAVVNPLMAMKEQIEKVYFLHTEKTAGLAARMRKFVVDYGFSEDDVVSMLVSDSLRASDGGKIPPAHEAAAQKVEKCADPAFNLAGGMNFQVAACIQAARHPNLQYVYPERDGTRVYRLEGGAATQVRRLDLPPAADVLSLQGLAYSLAKGKRNGKLTGMIKSLGLDPDKFQWNVSIGGTVFDLVWNYGNELRFLKSLDQSKKQSEQVREARTIIRFATGRKPLAELFHRRVFAHTDNEAVKERLRTEGGGKISVLVSGNFDNPFYSRQLEEVFMPQKPSSGTKAGKKPDDFGAAKGEKALLAVLGRDPTTTFISLWSHKADRAYLFYTPGDQEVENAKNGLESCAQRLPCPIRFIETDIFGLNILDTPPVPEKNVQVNVTPGSKSQAAFLSLWAKMRGARVFSIDDRVEELPSGESLQKAGPSAADFLLLKGVDLKSAGTGKDKLLEAGALYDPMMDFFRVLADHGDQLNAFPEKSIELGGFSFEMADDQGTLAVPSGRGQKASWKMAGGEWLEKLAGYALAKCDADDVAVRVRTNFGEYNAKEIAKKYGCDPHMTDIDVAAFFQGNYYVVSCKQSRQQPKKVCAEAAAVASVFGRFCVPLVFMFKHAGEPESFDGVYRFGIKTLADFDSLKALLAKARDERRTTARG